MATNMPGSPNSNKRKRDSMDHMAGRMGKIANPSDPSSAQISDSIYNSLLAGINDATDPQIPQDEQTRTAQAALQQQQAQMSQGMPPQQHSYPEPHLGSGIGVDQMQQQYGMQMYGAPLPPSGSPHGVQGQLVGQDSDQGIAGFDSRGGNKPAVGTQAWHQQRKDNHKEVERRRREVINEGIENIAKMIPGNEKNKGAILQRTCQYITELQQKIASFNDERHVFEVTMTEIENRNRQLREQAEHGWRERDKWMARCREAGLEFPDYEEAGVDLHDDGQDGKYIDAAIGQQVDGTGQ